MLALLGSIDSIRYSVRSVLGLRIIEYLPGSPNTSFRVHSTKASPGGGGMWWSAPLCAMGPM
eukprot:12235645-Alexandrium_andersonii.AAC.1